MRPILATLYSAVSLMLTVAAIAVNAAAAAPQVDWSARFRAPGLDRSTPQAMALGPDDSIYVTGWSHGSQSDDFTTVRYTDRGQLLWSATYDGPLHAQDVPVAMAVDTDGSVYVTGYSFGVGTGNDCTTVKYDEDGQELWAARYDGPAHAADLGSAVAIGDDGSVYVGGTSSNGSALSYDALLIKYDPAGNQQWAVRRNGTQDGRDGVTALALTQGGAAYMVGEANGNSAGGSDFFTARIEPDGSEAWLREYQGPLGGREAAIDVAVDETEHALVTGVIRGIGGFSDFATLKYDPAGELLWTAILDGEAHETDSPAGVAVHTDGSVYVSGTVTDRPGDYDIGIVKYGADGDLVWSSRYRSQGSGEDEVGGFFLDDGGSLYLTGGARANNQFNLLTLKYASDGRHLWAAYFNSRSSNADWGQAIAVDSARDVVVSGHSVRGVRSEFVTLKYSGSNGVPVAEAGANRTVSSPDAAANVLLDASQSTDPDGDALTYRWREGNLALGDGMSITVPLAQGTHAITLEVEDAFGAVDRDQVRISVVTPPSTPGARVTGSGVFSTPDGEARFSIAARAARNGRASGTFTFTRPDGSRLRSGALTSIVTEGDLATVYGKIKINRRSTVTFVLELQDLGEPGAGQDTFRLELADGSEPITGALSSGNVVVTP